MHGHVCMCKDIYVHVTHMYVCMYVWVYLFMHVCVYVYMQYQWIHLGLYIG